MRKRITSSSLSDALGAYVKRLDSGKNLTQARVAQVWAQAVGPEIARHTAGAHIRGDELVVYVDSPIWAAELSTLSPKLAGRLNECLGEELVGAMRFSVSRKVVQEREHERRLANDESFYEADDVEPEALSAEEVEQIKQSAAAIQSKTLRETVIRTTIKDLELQRGRAKKEAREQARDKPKNVSPEERGEDGRERAR